MGNLTNDGEQTFPDSQVRLGPVHYERVDDKLLQPFYICALITTNGQLWAVRWNGPSVTEQNIRDLWHNEAELFTRMEQKTNPVPDRPVA